MAQLPTVVVAGPVPDRTTPSCPRAAQRVVKAVCAVLTVACGLWALSDLIDGQPLQTRAAGTSITPEGPRIQIPAIKVDAKVVSLGLTKDGVLETPKHVDEAGWWSGGSAPGKPGPAVIVGHRDSAHGPALFYALPTLEPGMEIRVFDARGVKYIYVVDRIERHDKDTFPTRSVYGSTTRPTLRLLTCGGRYDPRHGYEDNHIVFAHAKRESPTGT